MQKADCAFANLPASAQLSFFNAMVAPANQATPKSSHRIDLLVRHVHRRAGRKLFAQRPPQPWHTRGTPHDHEIINVFLHSKPAQDSNHGTKTLKCNISLNRDQLQEARAVIDLGVTCELLAEHMDADRQGSAGLVFQLNPSLVGFALWRHC